MRKEHPSFRMRTAGQIRQNIHFDDRAPAGTIVYTINGAALDDSWKATWIAFNGTGKQKTFILPEGKGYLADHFHQDKVEVYWADKDLVLLTALSGVRGAKPEVMLFQDAQAAFYNELTWWAKYADKN